MAGLIYATAKVFSGLRKEDETVDEEELIRDAFYLFDTDHSGEIDVVEFQALAQKCGFKMSLAECGKVICEVDKNANGTIDIDEFTDWWKAQSSQLNSGGSRKQRQIIQTLQKEIRENKIDSAFAWLPKKANKDKRHQVRALFEEFDTDKNEKIDNEEFEQMTRRLGYSMSKKQLKKAFNSVDADRNGTIDFDEFYDWWTNKRSLDSQVEAKFSETDFIRTRAAPVRKATETDFLDMASAVVSPAFVSLNLLDLVDKMIDSEARGKTAVSAYKAALHAEVNRLRLTLGEISVAQERFAETLGDAVVPPMDIRLSGNLRSSGKQVVEDEPKEAKGGKKKKERKVEELQVEEPKKKQETKETSSSSSSD
jgi:Ca2+-binding EF-hand superfamily protein